MSDVPIPRDDPVNDKIRNMCKKAFKTMMNGVGYGRIDVRIDKNNEPYFLEINPNCGLF